MPDYKESFMNIKFDYCKCIRIYEKVHLKSDFWQSKYILQNYYFDGGQKFTHVSYNEWFLVIMGSIIIVLEDQARNYVSRPPGYP